VRHDPTSAPEAAPRTTRSLSGTPSSVSAHAFRRHPRMARAALLLLGALVLPLLTLEAAFRVAPLFVERDRTGTLGAASKRIVCVGDSFTFGVYFPAASSYPRRLQAHLDAACGAGAVEVVNAGRPGRPTSEIRSLLPELLARVRPDVVVVLGGVNDRWNHGFGSPPLQFLADHSRLFKAARVWLAARSGGRLDDDRPRAGDTMEGAIVIDDATLVERVAANLRAIAGTIRESGATPIFLTYPAREPAFSAPSEALRAAAAATATRLIDLGPIFVRELAARPDLELLIPADGHPYPSGNDLMARSVAEVLLEELRGTFSASSSPSAVAPPAAPLIALSCAADSPSTLLVRTAPRRRFHLVMSRSQTPRLRLQRCSPDLGFDELVRLSTNLPSLSGVTDESGCARVELPADALRSFAPGADGLRAAALLLDARMPEDGNVGLWAEASSDVVVLRPGAPKALPAQPSK
jgi:lysophospholipase L1-like esterase